MTTKICPRQSCKFEGTPQPLSSFHKAKNTKDGHAVYCRTCRTEQARILRQRPDVQERGREAVKRYRASNRGKAYRESPEYRESINAYLKEYTKRPEVRLHMTMKRAEYRTRNALKERARIACRLAVESGKASKPDHCEWCKKSAQPSELQGHHWRGYDPEHWLDVKYVHRACHFKCENVKPENWP